MSDYDEEIIKKCKNIIGMSEFKTKEEIAIECYKIGYQESASDVLLYLKNKENN